MSTEPHPFVQLLRTSDGGKVVSAADAVRRAVHNNRTRPLSAVARQFFKLHAEWVERGFVLTLDRRDMWLVWPRGREKVQKRHLIHVAGNNLGLIMCRLTQAGMPRELRVRASVWLGFVVMPDDGLAGVRLVVINDQTAVLLVPIHSDLLA
jgi:transposase